MENLDLDFSRFMRCISSAVLAIVILENSQFFSLVECHIIRVVVPSSNRIMQINGIAVFTFPFFSLILNLISLLRGCPLLPFRNRVWCCLLGNGLQIPRFFAILICFLIAIVAIRSVFFVLPLAVPADPEFFLEFLLGFFLHFLFEFINHIFV